MVYLLRAMRNESKTSQDLEPDETIFNPRVVDKEMNEWRAKLRDEFGIDAMSKR